MKISDEMKSYLVNKYYEIKKQDNKLFSKHADDPNKIVKDVINFIQRKHVQVAVIKKDEYKIFIILESNQFMDWLYNLWFRFSKTPYKETGTKSKIKVHMGFYKSYLMIRNDILTNSKNSKKVIIMGQSLGSAISTFAALDIQYNDNSKNICCMITGSPRVGNQAFVDSYNKRVPDTYRYVYGNDLVPNVPFKWMGFKHVNKEIHLGKKRKHGLSIFDHLYNTGAYINDLTIEA